jgi:hypothetical protein
LAPKNFFCEQPQHNTSKQKSIFNHFDVFPAKGKHLGVAMVRVVLPLLVPDKHWL